ncbi:hypothetical protein M413DRAFT_441549 [Hebeloma cylindrosporum]|uniref:Uncharacterized protein n=1 Tax=Hebeloma cylindrosporum TaxID=76867 RepID=A0A0C3CCE9_HEBCY|nr:hypothetical protein M413DRAFT_441549 [Hebeloma cylindrosporum h7]
MLPGVLELLSSAIFSIRFFPRKFRCLLLTAQYPGAAFSDILGRLHSFQFIPIDMRIISTFAFGNLEHVSRFFAYVLAQQ